MPRRAAVASLRRSSSELFVRIQQRSFAALSVMILWGCSEALRLQGHQVPVTKSVPVADYRFGDRAQLHHNAT